MVAPSAPLFHTLPSFHLTHRCRCLAVHHVVYHVVYHVVSCHGSCTPRRDTWTSSSRASSPPSRTRTSSSCWTASCSPRYQKPLIRPLSRPLSNPYLGPYLALLTKVSVTVHSVCDVTAAVGGRL